MPKITALVHASGDTTFLPKTLESLKPCDELIVIDASGAGETERVARDFGATVKKAIPGVTPGAYIMDGRNDWILVLQQNEELDNKLMESLQNWKEGEHEEPGFAFEVCEKRGDDSWCKHVAEMRLVNRRKINWTGDLPPNNTMAAKLPGDILRYPK